MSEPRIPLGHDFEAICSKLRRRVGLMTLVGAVFGKGKFAVGLLDQSSLNWPQGRPDKRYLTLASWRFKASPRMGLEGDIRDLSAQI